MFIRCMPRIFIFKFCSSVFLSPCSNKIFGGHLMRAAYELASICAFDACAVFPVLLAMDDVTFLAPVEIGSVLNLRAVVPHVCADRRWCFVAVEATMTNTVSVRARQHYSHGAFSSSSSPSSSGSSSDPRRLTNEFHFVFLVDAKHALPSILPESYADIIRYLDARRRQTELESLMLATAPAASASSSNASVEPALAGSPQAAEK